MAADANGSHGAPASEATSPQALNRAHSQSALGELFRIPVFRRLWAGITISSLGDWLGLLATTALAAYLTRDSSGIAQGAAVSGVLVTRLLPDLILGPIAGAIVDRFDRRKLAIICDLAAAVLYAVIALTANLPVLLIAQFLVEAVGLFSTPAKQAMWVNIVPRDRLATANQLNYVSIYGMVPVASVLFALLSTISQFFGSSSQVASSTGLMAGSSSVAAVQVALFFNAATFLLTSMILYFSRRMIPAFVGERSTTRSVFTLIREGISFVKNSRVMRALYLGILGAFAGGGLVAGVAQSYVGALGAGNAGYGILFGAVFTGLALGMLVGPKVLPAVPRRVVFIVCIGLAGVMLLVMSVIQDFVGAVVTASAMGSAAGIAWITGFTMIGHEVSDQLRGRVFAFVMSSVRLTLLGSIAIGPVLAGAFGGHQLTIGQFTLSISGAGLVLALGGAVAVIVAIIAGRQVGGTKSGVLRRMMQRRRLINRQATRSGVLIAVEGSDRVETRRVADAVAGLLGGQGWDVVDLHGEPTPAADYTSLPVALRAGADLAERLRTEIDPRLADGAVVIFRDYLDSLVVRFGALGGLDEFRLVRLAQWVSDGSWPDLTIMVEAGAAAEPLPADAVGAADDLEPADPGLGTTGIALELAKDYEDGPRITDPDDLAEAEAAYRERVASAPERYVRVSALAAHAEELSLELLERIASVLRSRDPRVLTDPTLDLADATRTDEAATPSRS
ncbi:MFS transporter [Nakamurella sp. A5-74]|uniref:MFS transporter n=1 Tax=Nakamurella sp. A5-74 TaxID=3158264 RepID=A0AAU8DTW9_9ACTN